MKELPFKYVVITEGKFSIELPHVRQSLGKGSVGCAWPSELTVGLIS